MSLAYDIHGRVVRIEGAGPELEAAIGERLAWAQRVDGAGADAVIEYATPGRPEPPRGRTVYESPLGTARYDDEADVLAVAGDGIAFRCLCSEGRAEIAVDAAVDRALWLASRPLLTLALTELLKRRERYPVHAGAVRTDGGGAIVIPGATGAGKSTLSIALGRAGLGFMSDDLVLLARRPDGMRVLGFPERADVSSTTAAFFPELERAASRPLPPGWRKLPVDVEQELGARLALDATPALVVFPRVAGTPESALTPLSRAAALVRLSPDVLLTAPAASQAHLDALADLVEASTCYELATGTDLDGAVALLREAAT